MKCCLLFLFVTLLPGRALALTVERFEMGRHYWTVVHQPGGLTVEGVARNTRAIDVSVFGFFGHKTINGTLQLHGVDWHMMYGKEVVADHFNRWVLASYPDGTVRICSSPEVAYRYGRPSFGAAGVKIPPRPDEKLPRQFWAVKGRFYFRIRMRGDRWDCQRVARQWGFDSMLHSDGGSSLVSGIRHPSIAKVYRSEDYFALRQGAGGLESATELYFARRDPR